MFKEEEKDQASSGWRFTRSASWTERPPRKSNNSKPQWNSKARACLPPLQPLSIVRPSMEEWPRAGCDDLGIWHNPPTPGAKPGSTTPRENSTSEEHPIEFEFRKDMLAFFDKECSRILDHIYLGSDAIAKNREILHQNGITHVLNCVGFACPEYFRNDLVYKTLWLQDCPSEDITSILYDVFDYFEDVEEQGGRVLVHCCQGVSRSASLVIAYLMWKEGQSFDDAFQHVRAARGITNPNVGFACQLLQCQKRVHALPASPTSVLRMYRMAPHSPYDPLHLVPKLLCQPRVDRLDSRGAFIIHIPSALYVWIGKYCSEVMADNARAAASQIIRYEKARGPVMTVKEGEETPNFWDALSYGKDLAVVSAERRFSAEPVSLCADRRKLDEYDLDFEIFHKALAGGVVPLFPLSRSASETCLPARENGWDRVGRNIPNHIVKEIVTCAKLKLESNALQICNRLETMDGCKELEDNAPPSDISMPSSGRCDSPDSFASYVNNGSTGWPKHGVKGVGFPATLPDISLSHSPSFNLVDSFSSFFVSKPKSYSTSPSISPSTSDYSSLFTCSPSSSDFSFVSSQPSPCRPESRDDSDNSGPLMESSCFIEESALVPHNVILPPSEVTVSTCYVSSTTNLCSTSGEGSQSLTEYKGVSFPPLLMLPIIDEVSQISEDSTEHRKDDVVDVKCSNFSCELDGEKPIPKANLYFSDAGVLSRLQDNKKYGVVHLTDDDISNKIIEVTNLLFYKWPSTHKVGTCRPVSVMLIPAVSFGRKIADALNVWIGHNAISKGSHNHLICNELNHKDDHTHGQSVSHNLLAKEGLCKYTQIKMVEEGEEPEEFSDCLTSFS